MLSSSTGLRRTRAAIFSLLMIAFAVAAWAEEESPDKVTALLIIDIQEFYFPGGALPLVEPEAASLQAGKVLESFRNRGESVIHVGHNARAGRDFHADVTPVEGEMVIFKDEVCAFVGTDLQDHLQGLGVTDLVIVGMQTHMCLEGAVRAASDLGYRCTIVADACATRDLEYGGKTVAAADVHLSTLSTLDRVYGQVVDAVTYLENRSQAD